MNEDITKELKVPLSDIMSIFDWHDEYYCPQLKISYIERDTGIKRIIKYELTKNIMDYRRPEAYKIKDVHVIKNNSYKS